VRKADSTALVLARQIYIQLLNAYRLCGRLQQCEATFLEMQAANIEPGNVGHNILMSAAVEAGAPSPGRVCH
jgi:pentatricopeptide repeat protein